MADDYEDIQYIPNEPVIDAFNASQGGLQPSGGVQGASGLGPAHSVAIAPRTDYSNLPVRYRAAVEQKAMSSAITASHNAAMESVARAKYALDASRTYYENAKTRNALIQQAHNNNQAAGFLAAHSYLDPNDPNYYNHVNRLAAQFPGAASDDAVKIILNNPKLREQAVMKGDAPGEVATRKALQEGWITAKDLQDQSLYQNGLLNHNAVARLADIRQGQAIEPPQVKQARIGLENLAKRGMDLSPDEESLRNIWTSRVLQYETAKNQDLGITPQKPPSAASFFARPATSAPATTPLVPRSNGQIVSIPKAPPPPTPAPTPMSPEAAANQYLGTGNE